MRLWRWFWGADEALEFRALRARGAAFGVALPRTMMETITDLFRIAARKRRAVWWRHPDPEERARFGPVVELFADALDAIATPADETWLIGERVWCGFPDPPCYLVVFLDAEGRVIAAADLDRLPRGWTMPAFPMA